MTLPSREKIGKAIKWLKEDYRSHREGHALMTALSVLTALKDGEIGEYMEREEIERVLIGYPFRVGKIITCQVCHKAKHPCGRSVPPETYSSYCNADECDGYKKEPLSDGLFPNELSNDDAIDALTSKVKPVVTDEWLDRVWHSGF